MLNETLIKIEQTIKNAESLGQNDQKKLLSLIADLKSEVTDLSSTHEDQAQSIAGFTQVTSHEATRATPNTRLLSISLDGLKSSVQEFEASHPRLVATVNSIHQMFANIGLS